MKWLLKKYMAIAHIETYKELSDRTGIQERTLRNHMKSPTSFRLFEIMALNDVLKFEDADLLMLIRGEI